MSLAATLLGVPGLIKKLRGHNAPAAPLGLTGSVDVVRTTNSIFATSHATWKPALRTHQVLDHASLNNSTELVVPVASLTGKGAFDGVWVKMTLAPTTSVACTYEVQIIVDGVDIAPTGYSHALAATVVSNYYASVSAAVGGAAIVSAPQPPDAALLFPVFERASVPIPFNSSLEVNLVHVSSTSASFRTSCWVNAWLTE
jgi:hypothetical protein